MMPRWKVDSVTPVGVWGKTEAVTATGEHILVSLRKVSLELEEGRASRRRSTRRNTGHAPLS